MTTAMKYTVEVDERTPDERILRDGESISDAQAAADVLNLLCRLVEAVERQGQPPHKPWATYRLTKRQELEQEIAKQEFRATIQRAWAIGEKLERRQEREKWAQEHDQRTEALRAELAKLDEDPRP